MEYPCGQCGPCLKNRARTWVARLLLEAQDHEHACFITLTYSPESEPEHGSLNKRHLQTFLKRVRKEVFPRRIRYYACGEYGDKSERPHYHAILFGISPTEEDTIRKCWPQGFTVTGTAEPKSMAYVAQYVQKKAGKKSWHPLLKGVRTPEFQCMSLKPGLGYGSVNTFKKSLETTSGKYVDVQDISHIRMANNKYPLGRYLKEKLRNTMGVEKKERKEYNRKTMYKIAGKQAHQNVTQYQKERKSKVQQQPSLTKGKTI